MRKCLILQSLTQLGFHHWTKYFFIHLDYSKYDFVLFQLSPFHKKYLCLAGVLLGENRSAQSKTTVRSKGFFPLKVRRGSLHSVQQWHMSFFQEFSLHFLSMQPFKRQRIICKLWQKPSFQIPVQLSFLNILWLIVLSTFIWFLYFQPVSILGE